MSRKSVSKGTARSGTGAYGGDDWKGFITRGLSEEERTVLSERINAGYFSNWIGLITHLLSSGYKLSFAPHNRGETVIATLTARTTGTENDGYALSAFAPTLMESVYALLYKHYELLDTTWLDPDGKPYTAIHVKWG